MAWKTALFTILVPGTATALVPYLLVQHVAWGRFPPPGAVRLLGAAVCLAGVATYLWCARDFTVVGRGTPAPIDPPEELVASGLYRHTRNPMYVGVLSIVFGVGLFLGAAAVLLYALGLLAMFHSFVVLYEEPTLRRLFGAAYSRYCDRVPRWLLRGRAGRAGSP